MNRLEIDLVGNFLMKVIRLIGSCRPASFHLRCDKKNMSFISSVVNNLYTVGHQQVLGDNLQFYT